MTAKRTAEYYRDKVEEFELKVWEMENTNNSAWPDRYLETSRFNKMKSSFQKQADAAQKKLDALEGHPARWRLGSVSW